MEKNKKITGIVLGVLVLIAVGCTLFSTAYSVSEQEQAVVTMFGKVQSVKNAGIYFKIPYIQHVTKVDTTTHGTGIGYSVSDSGQNIDSDESESLMITSDFNFVNIDFYLEYKVSDPVAYLYNSSDPEEILKNFVLAAVRSTVIDYPVDERQSSPRIRPSTTPTSTATSRFLLPRRKRTASSRTPKPKSRAELPKPKARYRNSTNSIRNTKSIRMRQRRDSSMKRWKMSCRP